MADYVPLPYSAIIELDRQAIQNGLTASSFLKTCNRPGWMFKPSAARYCRGLGGEVVKGE